MSLEAAVAAATSGFLERLPPSLVGAARLPFDGEARRRWAYWPASRAGVPLSALDRGQIKAAHRLLATLLPLPAFAQAVTVMNLDEVLDRIEGYAGDRRHGLDYWIAVFGRPGEPPWGVRFEGHHVSVHATLIDGEVRLTPLFLGANPAVVDGGSGPVVAPLAAEERLGFELLHALPPEQRSAAVIADRAPDDIATRNLPRLPGMDALAPGVPLHAVAGAAAAAARVLVGLYLARLPAGAGRPDPRQATFAWAGAAEPGIGHYYRVVGPRLLIELDNTQNNANHVHTVVRDPGADFGDDLLAAHHRRSHAEG